MGMIISGVPAIDKLRFYRSKEKLRKNAMVWIGGQYEPTLVLGPKGGINTTGKLGSKNERVHYHHEYGEARDTVKALVAMGVLKQADKLEADRISESHTKQDEINEVVREAEELGLVVKTQQGKRVMRRAVPGRRR